MSRLPKSKSPAVSTPTSPSELAQKLKSFPQGDSRALAASSTAIALSIASPFYDIRDPSNDDAIVRGRSTGWQTAYSAARIAVEIAKESSDMFLPLKAVVGAMSALMKNCEVRASRLRAECLLTLCPPLALANGGQHRQCEGDGAKGAVTSCRACLPCKRGRSCGEREENRASEVRTCTNTHQSAYPPLRKLEGVIAKLEPLSDQHALLKFLRNIDNAKTLMGFVQELADAITDYQV